MGGGSWSSNAFDTYTRATKIGYTASTYATTDNLSVQEIFKQTTIHKDLDPKNVMRECCDSEEHPNTFPVILALDVTGSMGQAAVKTAQKLNEIMTDLYADKSLPDIEFCVMGIGDLCCDRFPIQISQFESDIRIAEQLDQIYFEFGGGGNSYESYTAAWYMGINHCVLDCWKRGKKGLIITIGDELPNPYLPKNSINCNGLEGVTGDKLQCDIETKELLEQTLEKFNIYHLSIDDSSSSYQYYKRRNIDEEWKNLLKDNYYVCTLNDLAKTITNIIIKNSQTTNDININDTDAVSW